MPKTLILLLSVFLLFTSQSKAQDLIVTYSGDSMNVRIGRIYSDRIMYSVGTLKQSIEARKVSSFQRGFYTEPVKIENNSTITIKEKQILHLGINYSWSYRYAKIPSGLNDFLEEYIQKSKSGTSYGVELGFFINEQTALGFTFNRYNSTIRYDNVLYQFVVPDTSILGALSDNITISYYAPSAFFKFSNFKESLRFMLSASIGVTTYENNAEAPILSPDSVPEIGKMLLKGGTIGIGIGISAEIKLDKNFYIGPKIDLFTGTITDLSYEDKYTKSTISMVGEGESLARISLGGTLRIYF